MTAPYHGVTVSDVELIVMAMGGKVSPPTIRSWLSRGKITRSRNGQIDPESVINWWEIHRKTRMVRVESAA